jgi:hypothetical protein
MYYFKMNTSRSVFQTKTCTLIYCLMVINFLALSTSALALDLTAIGTFQSSELSTNLAGGFDTAVINNETYTNNGFNSGTAFGGGVLLSQAIMPAFSIETGLLCLPRSMSQTVTLTGSVSSTLTANYSFTYWQIPLLFRFHFLKILSVGFGGYYAHAIGNIKYTESSPNAALNSSLFQEGTMYQGYEEGDISRSDYGLLYAVGANVPLPFVPLSLYVDGRYAMGLKNIHTGQLTSVNVADSDNNKWHDFQLLAGFQLSLYGE